MRKQTFSLVHHRAVNLGGGHSEKTVKAVSQKHKQDPLRKDNNFGGGFEEIAQKRDRPKNFFGRFDLYLRGF
ncbi:hypothetical protein ACT3TP_04450 [Glutamicibacter sp. AOP38-B1-38]|uniref:hypothetical protein n=1 Tax=Glutamicibacter sp. AOP38-B1-38 TaxID=3457680 RepID=UPI004033AA80